MHVIHNEDITDLNRYHRFRNRYVIDHHICHWRLIQGRNDLNTIDV